MVAYLNAMKKLKLVGRVFLLAWVGCSGFNTILLAKEKDPAYGFYIKDHRKVASVPFDLIANLIIVPVKINNSDTLRFVFDTGVRSIVLTDTLEVRKQFFKAIRKTQLTGLGKGNSLTASVAINNQVSVGNLLNKNQTLVYLSEDILSLSELVGKPVHGILGYEAFKGFVVTIDFGIQQLIFYKPNAYKYRKSKGQKLPLQFDETKPYLDSVSVSYNGINNLKVKLLIDTGASHALSLDHTSDPNITIPEKSISGQLGRGLNGLIIGHIGRINAMQIGSYRFNDILASFPDTTNLPSDIGAKIKRQGSIGCEILKKFVVTIHFEQSYLVLRPIRRRMKEAFEHNMSGMEIISKGRNFHDFVINYVIDDSPAKEAGLLPGDTIISINNKGASRLTINEIYRFFQQGEGKQLNMLIKRSTGDVYFANVVLKKII